MLSGDISNIDGFYIGSKVYGSSSFTYKTMHLNTTNVQESVNGVYTFNCLLNSLRKATKYVMIVQAFNKEGEGEMSKQVLSETFVNGKLHSPT